MRHKAFMTHDGHPLHTHDEHGNAVKFDETSAAQRQVYRGWEVLGGLVRSAARSIEEEVGRDVLDYIIAEGMFDSFVREELTVGRDEKLGGEV